MITRERADLFFSELAVGLEAPSPPNPYLRALVRARMSVDMAQAFSDDLEDVVKEIGKLQDRVRLLKAGMDSWAAMAESYARDMARADTPGPRPAHACEECGRALCGDGRCLGCLLTTESEYPPRL